MTDGEYYSACMQSSAALLSVSIGIMAIIFITDLSPSIILIIDVFLAIAIFSLIKTMISSQYQLYRSGPHSHSNSPIYFMAGVLLMGLITLILTIFSILQAKGGI